MPASRTATILQFAEKLLSLVPSGTPGSDALSRLQTGLGHRPQRAQEDGNTVYLWPKQSTLLVVSPTNASQVFLVERKKAGMPYDVIFNKLGGYELQRTVNALRGQQMAQAKPMMAPEALRPNPPKGPQSGEYPKTEAQFGLWMQEGGTTAAELTEELGIKATEVTKAIAAAIIRKYIDVVGIKGYNVSVGKTWLSDVDISTDWGDKAPSSEDKAKAKKLGVSDDIDWSNKGGAKYDNDPGADYGYQGASGWHVIAAHAGGVRAMIASALHANGITNGAITNTIQVAKATLGAATAASGAASTPAATSGYQIVWAPGVGFYVTGDTYPIKEVIKALGWWKWLKAGPNVPASGWYWSGMHKQTALGAEQMNAVKQLLGAAPGGSLVGFSLSGAAPAAAPTPAPVAPVAPEDAAPQTALEFAEFAFQQLKGWDLGLPDPKFQHSGVNHAGNIVGRITFPSNPGFGIELIFSYDPASITPYVIRVDSETWVPGVEAKVISKIKAFTASFHAALHIRKLVDAFKAEEATGKDPQSGQEIQNTLKAALEKAFPHAQIEKVPDTTTYLTVTIWPHMRALQVFTGMPGVYYLNLFADHYATNALKTAEAKGWAEAKSVAITWIKEWIAELTAKLESKPATAASKVTATEVKQALFAALQTAFYDAIYEGAKIYDAGHEIIAKIPPKMYKYRISTEAAGIQIRVTQPENGPVFIGGLEQVPKVIHYTEKDYLDAPLHAAASEVVSENAAKTTEFGEYCLNRLKTAYAGEGFSFGKPELTNMGFYSTTVTIPKVGQFSLGFLTVPHTTKGYRIAITPASGLPGILVERETALEAATALDAYIYKQWEGVDPTLGTPVSTPVAPSASSDPNPPPVYPHIPGAASWHGDYMKPNPCWADGVSAVASRLTYTSGKPGGSAEGAIYTDPKTGQKFLVKHMKNEDVARCEVVGAHLYRAIGIVCPDVRCGILPANGKFSIFSPWIEGVKTLEMTDRVRGLFASQFAGDVWLANFDCIGLSGDNAYWLKGNTIRIEAGGSLFFRAMGDVKPPSVFNAGVWSNWETMLDKGVNSQTASAFKMAKKDPSLSLALAQAIQTYMTADFCNQVANWAGFNAAPYMAGRGAIAFGQLMAERAENLVAGIQKAMGAASPAAPPPVATPKSMPSPHIPAEEAYQKLKAAGFSVSVPSVGNGGWEIPVTFWPVKSGAAFYYRTWTVRSDDVMGVYKIYIGSDFYEQAASASEIANIIVKATNSLLNLANQHEVLYKKNYDSPVPSVAPSPTPPTLVGFNKIEVITTSNLKWHKVQDWCLWITATGEVFIGGNVWAKITSFGAIEDIQSTKLPDTSYVQVPWKGSESIGNTEGKAIYDAAKAYADSVGIKLASSGDWIEADKAAATLLKALQDAGYPATMGIGGVIGFHAFGPHGEPNDVLYSLKVVPGPYGGLQVSKDYKVFATSKDESEVIKAVLLDLEKQMADGQLFLTKPGFYDIDVKDAFIKALQAAGVPADQIKEAHSLPGAPLQTPEGEPALSGVTVFNQHKYAYISVRFTQKAAFFKTTPGDYTQKAQATTTNAIEAGKEYAADLLAWGNTIHFPFAPGLAKKLLSAAFVAQQFAGIIGQGGWKAARPEEGAESFTFEAWQAGKQETGKLSITERMKTVTSKKTGGKVTRRYFDLTLDDSELLGEVRADLPLMQMLEALWQRFSQSMVTLQIFPGYEKTTTTTAPELKVVNNYGALNLLDAGSVLRIADGSLLYKRAGGYWAQLNPDGIGTGIDISMCFPPSMAKKPEIVLKGTGSQSVAGIAMLKQLYVAAQEALGGSTIDVVGAPLSSTTPEALTPSDGPDAPGSIVPVAFLLYLPEGSLVGDKQGKNLRVLQKKGDEWKKIWGTDFTQSSQASVIVLRVGKSGPSNSAILQTLK